MPVSSQCAFSLAYSACWLVGQDQLFFDLLILDKSSSVLLFSLAVGLVPLLVFCMIVNFGNGFVLLAAEEGGGPPVRVVVYESADDACDCM